MTSGNVTVLVSFLPQIAPLPPSLNLPQVVLLPLSFTPGFDLAPIHVAEEPVARHPRVCESVALFQILPYPLCGWASICTKFLESGETACRRNLGDI